MGARIDPLGRTALRRLAGLAVGVHAAAETPREVAETADLVLSAPHGAARLLSALAREATRRLEAGVSGG